ncbi:hypothetical protein [Algibacillus agarilyticus]|nr:hypothetical protein [Algibacillus agarilyticus]
MSALTRPQSHSRAYAHGVSKLDGFTDLVCVPLALGVHNRIAVFVG